MQVLVWAEGRWRHGDDASVFGTLDQVQEHKLSIT